MEVECRVLLHQAFQLAQGLLQTAQIEQAHRCVVVGLRNIRQEGISQDIGSVAASKTDTSLLLC